ncbi:MAG: ACP S-malonyltransferase [Oscillospiraceae bacterium]|nr:ACP S-malonyltransferase [Oscillospiraceae bacterium]
MGKIAFVFSGQGDQHPGMGKALAEQYPAAAEVFKVCDRIRPGTSDQCFTGTAEELTETRNTQPCLYAMELAAAAVLTQHGIVPDAVAGFSLGELAACTQAGLLTLEGGFRLVCQRGALMQREAEKQNAAMAAVVKLTQDQVRELCSRYDKVYPVNFNCPGQITVSGLSEQLQPFFADVKAAGGRALPLKVSGGFHSPFMDKAASDFSDVLGPVELHAPAIPLYSNVTGQPYTGDAKALLAKQICSPVQWEQTIRNLIDAGIDTLIEIGPGKTLTNIIKKISGEVKTYCIAELPVLLSEVNHVKG